MFSHGRETDLKKNDLTNKYIILNCNHYVEGKTRVRRQGKQFKLENQRSSLQVNATETRT